MKTSEISIQVEKVMTMFPLMSKKVAKEIVLERIEKDKQEAFISNVRKNIELFLNNKGLQFSFIALSETIFGTSIYYRVNEVKYRFSDHSVTNFDRTFDEVHYSISDFTA